ncbi:MAG: DUF523 and DUF1722 domain-containing protein [Gammaproteobacteria bacterium]|nr:DUF523 and DUF1722 domain-containing protein [Gammaproteobacteria bacterium]
MPTPPRIPIFQRIPVGISQCLLGDKVRFDAGHKHDPYITGTLSRYFDFVAVCPEVAIGLGVPREPIRLVGGTTAPRAVGVHTVTLDVTDQLHAYGQQQARELRYLCGYIFKHASPSCGMGRVKIYNRQGIARKAGQGIYARAFMAQQPLIPCEQEDRLGDPELRENFIQRVWVLHRWRNMRASRISAAKLLDFHHRHTCIVLAHHPRAYKKLSRLAAGMTKTKLDEQADAYILELMTALKRIATPKQHAHVLQQLLGYLKSYLDDTDKQEMLETIRRYQCGEVPLIVPITLLKHHFRRHPDPYIEQQYYLTPGMEE